MIYKVVLQKVDMKDIFLKTIQIQLTFHFNEVFTLVFFKSSIHSIAFKAEPSQK